MSADPHSDSLWRSQFPLLWVNAFTYTLIASADRFTFNWLVDHELVSTTPLSSGLVLFMLGLPVFLFALPAGVLADRANQRTLMIGTQVAGVVVTSACAVAVRQAWMTVSTASLAAFVFGTVIAVGQPVRQSLVPNLVGRERLLRAVVAITIAANLGMILGPLVVGRQIRSSGAEAGFWVQAGLFGCGLLMIGPLRIPPPVPRTEAPGDALGSWWRDLREGLSFVRRSPALRALLFLMAVGSALMSSSAFLLLPQIADKVYGRDADDAALLFGLMGIGSLVTSLILFRWPPKRRGRALLINMMVGTSNQVVQGFVGSFTALLVLLFLWGFTAGLYINLSQVLLQMNAPPDRMGRVVAIGTLVSSGVGPIGALAVGALAGWIGREEALSLCGALSLVCVLVCFWKADALKTL